MMGRARPLRSAFSGFPIDLADGAQIATCREPTRVSLLRVRLQFSDEFGQTHLGDFTAVSQTYALDVVREIGG
jgi:hypothetical protein